MARIIGTIFTSDGAANVAAYTAGEACIAHRSLITDEWTVTHKRTGLALTQRCATRDDAVAFGMGASLIIRRYGDRGVFGDGPDTFTGPEWDALANYVRNVRTRPDAYLYGTSERRIPLGHDAALAFARGAIRYADDIAWVRHGVDTYGHGGA